MKALEFVDTLAGVPIGHLKFYPHLGNIAMQIILNPVEDMPIRLHVLYRIEIETNEIVPDYPRPAKLLKIARQMRSAIQRMGGAAQ